MHSVSFPKAPSERPPELRITVAIGAAVIIQTAFGLIWAGAASERLVQLERRAGDSTQIIERTSQVIIKNRLFGIYLNGPIYQTYSDIVFPRLVINNTQQMKRIRMSRVILQYLLVKYPGFFQLPGLMKLKGRIYFNLDIHRKFFNHELHEWALIS